MAIRQAIGHPYYASVGMVGAKIPTQKVVLYHVQIEKGVHGFGWLGWFNS